jgi:hypothetical protein
LKTAALAALFAQLERPAVKTGPTAHGSTR